MFLSREQELPRGVAKELHIGLEFDRPDRVRTQWAQRCTLVDSLVEACT